MRKKTFDALVTDVHKKFKAPDTLTRSTDDAIALSNAHNQAVLTYNSLVLASDYAKAVVKQNSLQVEKISDYQGKNKESDNPDNPVYVSFMLQAYLQVKTAIIRKLFQEYKIYEYYSQDKKEPFNIKSSEFSVTPLSKEKHTILKKKIDSLKDQKSYAAFEIDFEIKSEDHPVAFKLLPKTNILGFHIPTDELTFGGQNRILTTQVKGDSKLAGCTIIHSGSCNQLSGPPNKETTPYSHPPKSVKLSGNSAVFNSVEDGVLGLSTFAYWMVDFTGTGVDVNSLKSIKLTFSGNGVKEEKK